METASYILIGIGALTALVGFIVVLMVAFRVSLTWGLVILFLSWLVIPLVVFLVKYWSEARSGFLLSLTGWVVSGVGSFMLAGSVATTAVADFSSYDPPPRSRVEPARPEPADETQAVEAPPRGELVPTATPSPLPPPTAAPHAETAVAEPAAAPTPGGISADQAPDHVGETVLLALTDGTSRRVVIDGVGPDGLQVTQQLGGGAMSYSLRWDVITDIRPLQ